MIPRFWKGPAVRGRRMIMEQLEERIVMDAAVDPILQTDPFHSGHYLPLLDPQDVSNPVGNPAGSPEYLSGPHGHPIPLALSLTSVSRAFDTNLDVLLVSDALPGSKQVANAAESHTKIVFYSAAHDDLDAINEKLSDLTSRTGKKIAHLAVASPGEEGILALGSEPLDLDGAIAHRTSFKDISGNLEPHAQVQLYACSLAASDEGRLLVNAIATMTGADVFASTDVTGAKPYNWILEYSTYPAAQMASILDPYKLEQVPGHLGQLPGAGFASEPPHSGRFNQASIEAPGLEPIPQVNDVIYTSDDESGRELHNTPLFLRVADAALYSSILNAAPTDPGSGFRCIR